MSTKSMPCKQMRPCSGFQSKNRRTTREGQVTKTCVYGRLSLQSPLGCLYNLCQLGPTLEADFCHAQAELEAPGVRFALSPLQAPAMQRLIHLPLLHWTLIIPSVSKTCNARYCSKSWRPVNHLGESSFWWTKHKCLIASWACTVSTHYWHAARLRVCTSCCLRYESPVSGICSMQASYWKPNIWVVRSEWAQEFDCCTLVYLFAGNGYAMFVHL